MSSIKLQLRALQVEDELAFCKAVDEFKRVEPDWTFAFGYDDSLCFSNYIDMLERWCKGKDLPKQFVANTYLVGTVGNEIVGRISIRHVLNDFLKRVGGHIGYGVIPSKRNHGYATAMLKLALVEARALGLQTVLVTCDNDNGASIRVIEKNGGVLEDIIIDPEFNIPKRRYWITTETS